MITVQELQKRRQAGIQQILETIQAEIIVADDHGKRFINYDATPLKDSIAKLIIRELEQADYRVEYVRYGRSDTNLFLTIIWE